MSPRRRWPIYPDVLYPDAQALELIDQLLASWVFVQDEHLTEKQREKKRRAREKAEEAAAIAIARDGNFKPLVDMREHRNLSKEAEQLIGEKAAGRAKRSSHRSGPAHFKYS